MGATLLQRPEARHPWLEALVAAPEAQVRALVNGHADIFPLGRAEPADAAASLLYGLAGDDPARRAFDQGCAALLDWLRDRIGAADASLAERLLAMLDRLFAVIRRTRPRDTVADLHARYTRWFRLVETSRIDDGLDPRREFWRLLALTQDMAPADLPPRRLMPLWLDLCAEAGPFGRFADSCLDVGLLGLRRLPLGPGDDANEEAVCHGIARWAAAQRPNREDFLARWREVEAVYPRTLDFWPPLVDDVIAATEEHIATVRDDRRASFPAAAWWRAEMELPPAASSPETRRAARRRPIEPPPKEQLEAILRDARSPLPTLAPRIDRLMNGHRRYADATGDSYFLVRTACNVGMRLLREADGERPARGGRATSLARLALQYAPANVYAWALWRDGLTAQGALDAAETVGWEAIRRFPEDSQRRTQLATLLSEKLGRAGEAERLLRDTVALFPLEVAARPQLATVLADFLDQPEAAKAVLTEAIEVLPDNLQSYTQLALVLWDRLGDRAGAEKAVAARLQRHPDNPFGQTLPARIAAGLRLPPRHRRPTTIAPGQTATGDESPDLPAAWVRRALFRAETAPAGERDAAVEEVLWLLRSDPSLAYARYAAARVGARPAGGHDDTTFAFAFDRAARDGSAAALRALMRQYPGIDGLVAGVGYGLISGTALPAVPNDLDPGGSGARFAAMVYGVGEALRIANGNQLILVRDYAASSLSRDLAA